ncbi:adenosine 5'-monophosphoramidase HINT3-like [Malaya genurostris]|uniref:adenosine 5'-monophosphoramidase HINT3-like n=1 Tax=Malaya genurostris TaxID=325434 RepID=UPI0026F39D9F|nr:adenosine 5'-monophosphoramidase HINT3-like [Malaya genurostris]
MSSAKILENCIFCKIASGKNSNTAILFQNERIQIFKDIRPAADNHLLAIPKYHIDGVRSLTPNDKPLLEEMKTELVSVLRDQFQVDETTILLGFHIPPFTTVKHLHMHGIAPVSNMGFISKMIFKPGTMWFNTAQSIIDGLPSAPAT